KDLSTTENVNKVYFQSRNRVLSLEKDNCGFVTFMNDAPTEVLAELYNKIQIRYGENNNINTMMIAGEFCGGNVQKNVALTLLPKMFVIFAINIDDTWVDMEEYFNIESREHHIYNISRGGVFSATLSLQNPDETVKILMDITDNVEKECPF